MSIESSPGYLKWGVRESFVRYVASLPDGSFHCSAGAATGFPSAGPWTFEYVGESVRDDARVLKFRGDLRFRGHGGMMFVMLLDPWLALGSTAAELSVVDLAAWPDTSVRTALARTPAGWTSEQFADAVEVPLQLDQAGSELFNGIYPVGSALAPVHVDLTRTPRTDRSEPGCPATS